MEITALIKSTCQEVTSASKHVKINKQKLEELAVSISSKPVYVNYFDCPGHIPISESVENITAYVFIMDALNFCFWPDEHKWEYHNLSQAVTDAMRADPNFALPSSLAKLTLEEVKQKIFQGHEFPLLAERQRALNELGLVVATEHNNSFLEMLKYSEFDAQKLLLIISRKFLMFQDHSIYRGKQVFLYKRAQILIGDLYGAFVEKAQFSKDELVPQIKNIEQLTCFADYRIPQILHHEGVLEYSESLSALITSHTELFNGSEEEVEIRANMVTAVELLRDSLKNKGVNWTAVEVDWLLWQIGEARKEEIKPHHRTLSIYY